MVAYQIEIRKTKLYHFKNTTNLQIWKKLELKAHNFGGNEKLNFLNEVLAQQKKNSFIIFLVQSLSKYLFMELHMPFCLALS